MFGIVGNKSCHKVDGWHCFAVQVLPENPPVPPTTNSLSPRSDFYTVMRTAAGWIAAGKLASNERTAIFTSQDGVNWSSEPVFTFQTNERVSLYQALHNDARENVVLALVPQDFNRWLDIFRYARDSGLHQ